MSQYPNNNNNNGEYVPQYDTHPPPSNQGPNYQDQFYHNQPPPPPPSNYPPMHPQHHNQQPPPPGYAGHPSDPPPPQVNASDQKPIGYPSMQQNNHNHQTDHLGASTNNNNMLGASFEQSHNPSQSFNQAPESPSQKKNDNMPPPSAERITERTIAERVHHLLTVETVKESSKLNDFSLQSFLIDQGFQDDEITTAVSEHGQQQIDLCVSSTELQVWAGVGVTSFFTFVRFQLFMSFVIMGLQIANFGYFAGNNDIPFENDPNSRWGSRAWYDDFFITIWPSNTQKAPWLGFNIVCIILMVVAAPVYFFLSGWLYADVDSEENREKEKEIAQEAGIAGVYKKRTIDRIIRFNENGTIDVSAHYRSTSNVVLRRLASLVVFAVLIVFQVIASLQVQQSGTLGIAVLTAVLNGIYTGLGMILTEFEKYESMTAATRWFSLKLMLFKLANVITVYAAKDYNEDAKFGCVLDTIGRQFASLLLVEIVLTPVLAVIVAVIRARFHQEIADLISSINGDNDNLPPFDIAIEYLKVIYKVYLGAMTMAVFPLGSCMTFIALLVEYVLSRFRLFKICGRPQNIAETSRGPMAIVCFFLVIAALATPWGGLGWVLAGTTSNIGSGGNFTCTFP